MMTNEVSLKFLLDQLKALLNETKEINRKNKNTNEQFDSMENQVSDDELECLQDQFEEADMYQPEDTFIGVSNDVAVPPELGEHFTTIPSFSNFSVECTPKPVVQMPPSDLVVVYAASAPSVQTSAHGCAIGYNHCSLVDALTLLLGIAPHAAPCSSENITGYKLWKPGLRSA